ncbi:putative metalloprotease arx1 [Zygosaccharomyces mellis]|uniref:Probable metalloprotease ARX1 n=1 Tax=Zygosaccharomyces mellis TaxID=42258 RepID=A0A4C2E3Q4_9SACH|nr:putative metalloprotease arx1 [Zygosaccharomyces mellis]
MSLTISPKDSELLLKDKNILQESVLDKYRTAGQVTQTALKYVTGLINQSYHFGKEPRLTIPELCILGDSFMIARLEQFYKNKVNERGIAFPTAIDVDSVAQGWSPEMDDVENIQSRNKNSPLESTVTGILRAGDLVKITLGVHIDGYTSQVSHTMVIYPPGPQPQGPLLGGKADAVAAGHIAMESVVSLLACALTPEKLPNALNDGSRSVQGKAIRLVVDTIARSYDCCVVPGSRVRRIRRFLAGQNEGIVAEREFKGVVWTESHQEEQLVSNTGITDNQEIALRTKNSVTSETAVPSDDFTVKAGEVYLIDIRMCPQSELDKKGLVTLQDVDPYTGKSHKNDLVARSGAYVRDYAHSYHLKLKTARQLLTKIDRQGVYPFKLSHVSQVFPLDVNGSSEQWASLKKDLKSYRLGMSEITNNYLCVETPIRLTKWVPWDHLLKSTNQNGTLSFDATAPLSLPGHEVPLPKLGVSSLKLKSIVNSCPESKLLPISRESSTVLLCGADVSSNGGRPELLRITGGSKTCQASWIHSKFELNSQDPVVQSIFQLAQLTEDRRFGISIRETQPMREH